MVKNCGGFEVRVDEAALGRKGESTTIVLRGALAGEVAVGGELSRFQ